VFNHAISLVSLVCAIIVYAYVHLTCWFVPVFLSVALRCATAVGAGVGFRPEDRRWGSSIRHVRL
jgi:hypothetical protein